jgi:hypothetical protein
MQRFVAWLTKVIVASAGNAEQAGTTIIGTTGRKAIITSEKRNNTMPQYQGNFICNLHLPKTCHLGAGRFR